MSSKQPPTFNPDNGDSYTNWVNDIKVWKLMGGDGKVKQGPAVYLSLEGDARNAVRHLTPETLAGDNGVDKILDELDKVYLKDETARTFQAIKQFIDFRREAGCGFPSFYVDFRSKLRELKKYKIELSGSLEAYFLLRAANLSEDHERLARATASADPDDMKDKLQKIFGEFTDKEDSPDLAVKDCLYTQGRWKRDSGYGTRYSPQGSSGGRFGGGGPRDIGQGSGYSRYSPQGSGGGRFGGEGPQDIGQGSGYWRKSQDRGAFVVRCYECESIKHLVKDCPHRKQRVKFTEEITSKMVNVTLVTEHNPQLSDSLGKGVLDSACTKTVAGEIWVREYLGLLGIEKTNEVLKSKRKSMSTYRFGDGKETVSIYQLEVPFVMCDQEVVLVVDVVQNDIPLLIGRPTMTQLEMVLDTANHTVISKGKTFPLGINSAGHYEISVLSGAERCLIAISGQSKEDREKMAIKLHRQFAHPSKERLIRLVKQSQQYDRELCKTIENVTDACTFCRKYKQQKPRPIVSFPKSEQFNGVVCMDLKEVVKGKIWILHLVDAITGYTAASLINRKKKEVVIEKIFMIWLAYFGSPTKFHSDCGGEFVNEVLMELGEMFSIEISTTPGESPFSNGKVERGNLLLFEAMQKTMDDVGCSMETALAWSVCAKNCLQASHGFSPNMLVFGQNLQLPTITQAELPALNSLSSLKSDLVRKNLVALHAARENFIKAESSERIKRALRHQIRTYSEVLFSAGDKVYYKRRKDKKWRGPGKVLGKEGNFVLIRHGAEYYRCHPCHLLKVDSVSNGLETQDCPTRIGLDDSVNHSQTTQSTNNMNNQDILREKKNELESSDDSDTSSEVEEIESGRLLDEHEPDAENNSSISTDLSEPGDHESQLEVEVNKSNARDQLGCNIHNKLPRALRALEDYNKPGRNELLYISGQSKCNEVWLSIEVNKQEVINAKEKEIENLIKNDVYEKVDDEGQKAISCKWVITDKETSDGGRKVKARLVARGFEEMLIDKRVDSPTCSRQGLRLVFATASTMGWKLKAMDVSSAFLQGREIKREVYVKPPAGICEKGKLWRLKRCLYGLADAPREWYERVCEEMKRLDGKMSVFDKSVFLWHKNNQLIGLMAMHVDDFQYCGTEEWQGQVIQRFKETFKISKDEKGSFKYIGLEVEQTDGEVFVDQIPYCHQLEETQMKSGGNKDLPLEEHEKSTLRSLCGQVLWATTQTRPDASFEACRVSNYGSRATRKSLQEANRVIRKLKSDSMRVVFPCLGDVRSLKIVVYGDGSHASLPSGASQGANIVFLTGGGRSAPITWRSKRLDRVTKSPLATEVSAAADAADQAYLVASMVKEIFCIDRLPTIELLTDSKSLKDHLESTRVISDSRLRVDIARLREMQALGEVQIKWVPGELMLADCMTKKGASTDLLRSVLKRGVLPEHRAGQRM